MSLATEKDEVLAYLNDREEVDLLGLDFMTPNTPEAHFYSLFFKHRFELEQAGFIDFHENVEVVLDVQRTNIKPAGYVFFLNGGYTAIEQKELREEYRKQVEWRWRRGYEATTLIVAIIAIGFTAATYIFAPNVYYGDADPGVSAQTNPPPFRIGITQS